MKRRAVLLGPPGAGKGTVAKTLEAEHGLRHISSGQWFRREMKEGTLLGQEVREYIERGELVPDPLVLGVVGQWLDPETVREGFLLDGFPRTREQGVAFDEFCARLNAPLEVVLCLECPDEMIMDRITGRRVCAHCGATYHVRMIPPRTAGICDRCGGRLEQRLDDTEEVVRERLDEYRKLSGPLVDYYSESGRLVNLNAALSSESVSEAASRVLKS